MKIGFIYQWTDKKTGLKYIGRHEGEINDDYIGSGTQFIKEYKSRPDDFVREILWVGENLDVSNLLLKEEEYLSNISDDEFYYGRNRKYYNQVRNSSGYTSADNPMRNQEVVDRMMNTRREKGIISPWEHRVRKYGYEKACAMNAKVGNTFGSGNKGKPKSEEHKKKISETISKMAQDPDRQQNGGRKPAMPFEETIRIANEYGIKKGAEYLGIKRDAFYSRVLLAKKKLGIS